MGSVCSAMRRSTYQCGAKLMERQRLEVGSHVEVLERLSVECHTVPRGDGLPCAYRSSSPCPVRQQRSLRALHS